MSKLVIALSLFTAAGLIAGEANAACSAAGNLKISQGSFVLRCDIDQSGTTLSGSCQAGNKSGGGANGGDIVSGSFLKNGQFKIVVRWDGGSRGVYTAFVDDKGRVSDGSTFDATRPSSRAGWSTSRRFSCT